MILNDKQIRELCQPGRVQMITPFEEAQRSNGVISYGLSSFGYDLRLSNNYKIFTNINSTVIDPKKFNDANYVDFEGDVCIVPPNSFALAQSLEQIRMPDNVVALCLGKSTYARAGIICNFTPFEPGWFGYVTIEISNTTPLPAKIYSFEGIAQVLFFRGERPEVTYADRKGKYQGQTGITLPKVKE